MTYLRNQVAKIANIHVETLRYYERNGLISPVRGENGYRLYDDDIIEKLEIIKYAKACGFTLEEVKRIISVFENTVIDYNYVVEIIDKKVIEISHKMEHLEKMKAIMNKVKDNIDLQTQCPIKTTFKNLEL